MGKWGMVSFENAFDDVTRLAIKIKKENYLLQGQYQIIDQGKEYLAGYSNDPRGLYSDIPAIVFGDHTRILKYIDKPLFIGADGVKLLKIKRKDLHDIFVFYYLKSCRIIDTGYNRHFKWLKEFVIPLPPLPVQQQIANVLDRASALIEKRKAQIEKLDLLIKSQFIEMFGDPVTNPLGWETDKVEKHADILSGYPFDSSYYSESGVKICGGLIIMPNLILWDECKYWESADDYEEYLLESNDIVMAMDRPWISQGFKIAKIRSKSLPALLIQRTARIRGTDINQDYLFHCLIIGGFDRHCNVTGSLVPHISIKDIRSFRIMLPPCPLQNQFATFVQKVETQKSLLQQSLAKLELNYKSLTQKCFRGEIF